MIAVAPVGSIDRDLMSSVAPPIRAAFRAEVVVVPPVQVPERAWSPHRRQYSSTVILDELAGVRPPEWDHLLGVCEVDLYVPELNFVFGEADRARQVAVLSLWRLHPAGKKNEARHLLQHRAAIEAIHELGHIYGLGHCDDQHCVMWFSNTLAESDRKGTAFCRAHVTELERSRGRPGRAKEDVSG